MTRAERRRAEKSNNKKPTYNLTEEQLNIMIQERMDIEFEKHKQALFNEAFGLSLALSVDVLMEDFWPKSYKKSVPKFTEAVLDKCRKYQNGELDTDILQENLWNVAGIKLVVED